MTNAPMVSVVIPAYNAEWCIGRAIDSALVQVWQDFEVIVVNDGCTDGTPAVLRRYGERIVCIDQSNAGMSAARNAGIAAARGRYIAFLDADDRWLPDKLARQVALLEQQADLAFCSTCARFEDPDGRPAGEWGCPTGGRASMPHILANHAAVAGGASSVLARSEIVKRLGGFDEALRGAEDTDLWVRLAAEGGFACIADPLVVVLRRPDSVSRNYEQMRAGALAMTRKNRQLLPIGMQGTFWRSLYAGLLCDYAKWAYRDQRTVRALGDLAQALWLAPGRRGRLALGLAIAMLRGQRL